MTTFGWDMSHYDSVNSASIAKAVDEGIQFITHKAGGDANDAELGPWWNIVRNYAPEKLLLGAYWVLYPGNPAARARAFLIRLDAQCPGWRNRPFILQVDCEKWNGDPSTVPPVSDVNVFCDTLVQEAPKLRPIGYLPDWVYGNLTAFRYPLWSSKYVGGSGPFKALYPGDNAAEWSAYGGKSPTILQYSSHAVIGGQTTSDANAYRGTLAELTAIIAPGFKENTMDWTDDIDPSATEQSAGGALVTLLARSKELREATLPSVQAQVNSNGSGLSALSSNVAGVNAKLDVLATRPVVDPTTLAATISDTVVSGVLAGLAASAQTDEQTATLLVSLLGQARAEGAARVILA